LLLSIFNLCNRVIARVEYSFIDVAFATTLANGTAHADQDSIEEPLDRERQFLQRLGFAKPLLEKLAARVIQNSTTLEDELLADGSVLEDAYYAALAKVLDLPFLATIDPGTVADKPGIDTQLRRPRMVRCHLMDRAPALAIVPTLREILDQDSAIVRRAGLRQRIFVTTPTALRQAVWQAGSGRRIDEAANQLFDESPDLSARIVFSGSQGFLTGFTLTVLGFAMIVMPALAIFAVHVFLSTCYFLSLIFRGLAIHSGPFLTKPQRLPAAEDLPVYTVMVPLYQEGSLAEQLIRRLDRLDWPRAKLDIKLVCEAGDLETIAALERRLPGPEYEIVRVPNGGPKTKPKALNYALVAARGEFLVIYDAEDRPHPVQLREAHARFKTSDETIACLQAPLIISNLGDGWLSALFAVEYAGLFRRILPLLGSAALPMPLGGTSNHFRTSVLRAVGGWDPYNVTEDADLGHRLHRLGYRSEMITRPTLEEAPTETSVWLGQRGRWFKGWMQTWLVLMRHPRRLAAEFGVTGTITFHAMITGMLVSALGHPLIIVFLAVFAWQAVDATYVTPMEQALFLLDGINTLGAYVLFVTMGRQAMTRDEKRRLGSKWRWVPIYWLMISYAAWCALIELHTNPFFWKKTPHKPTVGSS
jgi:cellulose synthase/poly-beta-1,6-N-acetylglucosamine synthase-like glycosyltransferase